MSEVVQSECAASTTKLDFSKYQTASLVRELTDLASFPGALRTTLLMAIRFAALFVLLVYLLLKSWDVSTATWFGGTLYSLMAGLFLGICLGVLRVVTGALGNIESILNLVLNITGKVSDDYEKMSVGEIEMPTGGELMEQVYDNVFVPCLEKAIGKTLGVLGKPLVWCYRRTIGSAVRYVILRVQRAQLTEDKSQKIQSAVDSTMATVSREQSQIRRFAIRAAQFISHVGSRVRFYAMIPLYLAFVVAMSLAFVPLVVLWWLA